MLILVSVNCRGVLQQFANFGHKQQEELLRRQEKLQQAHDHLVENSKSMLAAQVDVYCSIKILAFRKLKCLNIFTLMAFLNLFMIIIYIYIFYV